jgi:methylglyoxal/glyoxal reductase
MVPTYVFLRQLPIPVHCIVTRSLFLVEQLRREGKIPPAGKLATPLKPPVHVPVLELSNGTPVPQLAFGLYMIPATDEGEQVIAEAIAAGYRHFDGASFYANEGVLGRALSKSGIPREEFFIASKVWNDAVKGGREAVRNSIEKSLSGLNFGDYFDLFLVHWPVPGFFVDAYKELEEMHKEGKLRALGISNFSIEEYEELVQGGITVAPAVNQIEVSPVMYRSELVNFFQESNILVAAYKPLNRASAFDRPIIVQLAAKHSVSPAQVMLRWSLQKGLIVVAKTSNADRMRENRAITHFSLSNEDMELLDSLSLVEDLRKRAEHETLRKTSL